MLKKVNWKAVLYLFIWLICLSGLVVLMGFIDVRKSAVRCTDVKIYIPGTRGFIDRAEIDVMLLSAQGPLAGRMLSKINIHQLENRLKANPFIEDANIYADMDGVIHVSIRQREPILRILNLTNQDFYIDHNGFKIPTSEDFTARVLVSNGFIIENFDGKVDTIDTKLVNDLYRIAAFIRKDSLWNDQIEQLYVNEQTEIEMVPRIGNHKIILGDADSLQVKFRNLLAFYKNALPKVGWEAYKTINLRYANQVVAERNLSAWQTIAENTAKAEAALKKIADSLKLTKEITSTVNN
jgi:cell division protein FtsQ